MGAKKLAPLPELLGKGMVLAVCRGGIGIGLLGGQVAQGKGGNVVGTRVGHHLSRFLVHHVTVLNGPASGVHGPLYGLGDRGMDGGGDPPLLGDGRVQPPSPRGAS